MQLPVHLESSHCKQMENRVDEEVLNISVTDAVFWIRGVFTELAGEDGFAEDGGLSSDDTMQ